MSGRRLRSILVLALFGAAAARAFGLLRPRPAPDVSRHPTVDGGPRPPSPAADPYQAPVVEPAAVVPDLAPLAPLEAEPVTETEPVTEAEPVTETEPPAPAEPASPGTLFDVTAGDPPDSEPHQAGPPPATTDPVEPAPTPTDAAVADEPQTSGAQTWSAPVDGACPDGFPVKAKLRSGIFHVPGGLAYERTHPDRCYPDPEAAEADGLRAAKR